MSASWCFEVAEAYWPVSSWEGEYNYWANAEYCFCVNGNKQVAIFKIGQSSEMLHCSLNLMTRVYFALDNLALSVSILQSVICISESDRQ